MNIETITQDLRYALRSFSRTPKFTLTLITVLALGIGGTTSIFTVVYGVLLQQLPFKRPERIVSVAGAASPPTGDALVWWGQSQIFESLCEYRAGGVNITKGDSPIRVNAALVSASFFQVFDSRVKLGRTFALNDEKDGSNRIAILSNRLHVSYFSNAGSVIGADIILDGMSHTIVGVMAEDFSYPGNTEIWVPKSIGKDSLNIGKGEQIGIPLSLRDSMIGRLKPGVSLQQAREHLKTMFARLQEISGQAGLNAGDGVKVTPLREILVRNYSQSLWALFAGVVFMMLIACANASTLMLSRAAAKKKEIAIRLCLGASPLRIMQQLLTEAIMLAVISGLAGILIAYWGVEAFRLIGPKMMPRITEIQINITILLFTLALSLFVGIIVGIVPAIQTLSVKHTEAIKEGGRSGANIRGQVRRLIVISEIALALVLLIGAGLTSQSFFRLTSVALGFDPKGVMTLDISLPASKYKGAVITKGLLSTNVFRVTDFYQQLLNSIENIPGVRAVGGVDQLPLGNLSPRSLWVDIPDASGGEAAFLGITGDYFRAMGIPLLRGRTITSGDTELSPKVAVVNEVFAKLFFGGKEPIGQVVVLDGESVSREVIGVVGDIKQTDLINKSTPQVYLAYSQQYKSRQTPLDISLVIRTDINQSVLVSYLRKAISSADPTLPIVPIKTMTELMAASASDFRFRGALLGSFAIIALIIAVAGVYGVVAYSTVSRTHEIGVRIALGATPQKILMMILSEGLFLALVGITLGLVAAFGLGRFMSSLLYGVNSYDWMTLAISSIVLIVGVVLACALPALAASKVDPAIALRQP